MLTSGTKYLFFSTGNDFWQTVTAGSETHMFPDLLAELRLIGLLLLARRCGT
jgi:hypothetical protein